MKKSLLVLTAAAIALSASGATPKQQQRHSSPSLTFDRSVELKNHCEHNVPSPKFQKKAPARLNSPEDVIYTAQGKRQDMTITASGLYVSMGEYIEDYESKEFSSHVVYGDDNEVYIFNIMPGLAADSYVKGVKEGDKIKLEFPQTVLWNEEYEDGVNVNILDWIIDEETGEDDLVPAQDPVLVFSVAEDGSMVAEGLSEERVLGLTYCTDDMWAGFCTWSLSLAPFKGTFVTVPDDIEVSRNFWTLKGLSLGYGWPVSFAQGGDEVYFQGLSEMMPQAWVKAAVEYGGSEAHLFIDQNQLVGTYGGSYVYTKCAQVESFEMFGEVYEFFELLPDDYRFELVWDYEEETIRTADPSVVLLFNLIEDDVDYADYVGDFVLSIQDSYEGTPVDPINLKFLDLMAEGYDYSIFRFELPAFSTDGDVLMTSDLSYVVYIDDEEWTFEPDDYNIGEPMVEIPWNFDSYWIMHWIGTVNHGVALFAEGIATLGVQSVYRYNCVETRSEIVSINVDGTSAVDSIADAKNVADVKYYGLDGREVSNPTEGIFVKRVTYDDGTVATFKKAIR